MPFRIIREDITRVAADAIVSCGNSALRDEGGVSGQIYAAAGPKAEAERLALGGCAPGDAVVSSGGWLRAKHIIHTVGTVWDGGNAGEEFVLRKCYKSVLGKAVELGCKSVATPLIASGRYSYPKRAALKVASEEIRAFLESHGELEVILVVFGHAAYEESERLFPEVDAYIADNYVDKYALSRERRRWSTTQDADSRSDEDWEAYAGLKFSAVPTMPELSLDELLARREKSFQELLREHITASGRENSDVYNSVGMSRQVFNNIWNREDSQPSKRTALLLAIALQLNYDQTLDLLRTLGFTLSRTNRADIIVECFIKNGNYDIFDIDTALYERGERTLCSQS